MIGLTRPQADAIRILTELQDAGERMRITDLAREMDSTRSGAKQMADALARRGWIEPKTKRGIVLLARLEPEPECAIELTATGQELIAAMQGVA